MKKLIVPVLASLTIILSSTTGRAAENVILAAFGQPTSPQLLAAAVAEPGSPVVGTTYNVGNDLHFSLGYRLWLNFWQTSIAKVNAQIVDPDIPTDIIPITDRGSAPTIDEFAPASIPSVGVRYRNFFASASVMISPDYNFDTASELVSGPAAAFGGTHTFRVEHNVTGTRNEVDVNLGYYIHPWIALTMGYKGIFQHFVDKINEFDITHGPISSCPDPVSGTTFCTKTSSRSQTNYNGGTLGMAINAPIPEGGIVPAGISIYGNGAGGGMGVNGFKYAIYGTIDAGLAYKPSSVPLLFTIGYKFQVIRSKTKGDAPDDHINDYTRGAILGLHFVF